MQTQGELAHHISAWFLQFIVVVAHPIGDVVARECHVVPLIFP